MTNEFKNLKVMAHLVNLATGLFPLILLVPFAALSGFIRIAELNLVIFSPGVLAGALINIAVGQALAFMIMKYVFSHLEEARNNWKLLSKDVRLISAQATIFMLLESLSVSFLAKNFTPIEFPREGVISFMLSISFLLMINISFITVLNSRAALYVRSINREAGIIDSISLKISIAMISTFLGTILMFITLQMVNSICVQIGRVVPVSLNLLFVIAAVTGIASMIFSLRTLIKYIVKPLKEMVEKFSICARGDFQQDVDVVTEDEVGQMAAMTNVLISSLNKSLSTVSGSVVDLESNKNDLGGRVEEMAAAVEEIRQNLRSTNDQMEDHSANVLETTAVVEQLARNIESLGDNIRKQTSIVTESSRAVGDISESNRELSQIIDQSRAQIEDLSTASRLSEQKLSVMAQRVRTIRESSQHLLEANVLISNVASQTNLLAMNAAIEAAHAGNSGRGFAVVADEIRKLAETSSVQSATISSNLKKVVEEIERVDEDSQDVNSTVKQIFEQVENVSGTVSHMSSFSEKVNEVSRILEAAFANLDKVSNNVFLGSSEMSTGNAEILKAITNMREISQRVLEAVNEITIGADEISKLSVEMLDQNKVTDGSLFEVKDALSYFSIKDKQKQG